eukprot:2751846-Prymnesium_polylepis.2
MAQPRFWLAQRSSRHRTRSPCRAAQQRAHPRAWPASFGRRTRWLTVQRVGSAHQSARSEARCDEVGCSG